MNRRKLMSGAAALAAYGALPREAHADAFSSVAPAQVGRSDLTLKANANLVACSGFTRAVADGVGNETVNTTMNARIPHWAPKSSSITDLVLAFPGFSFNTPEVDWNNSFTVTAAIEYPVGTFTPVYTNGSRTLSITAGRTLAKFDRCSTIVIPAGAEFYLKVFASWSAGNMFGSSFTANMAATGGWCNFGVGLADNTLTATVFSNNGVALQGYSPQLYGRLLAPSVILGILGTSHDLGASDPGDPNGAGANAFARAFRGQFPVMSVCRTGQTMAAYITRMDGANMLFTDAITHLIFDMTTNDIWALAASLATLQAQVPVAIAPYLARGVKVYLTTVAPRTTSTDNWITTANQTLVSAPAEAVALTWNAWALANYASIGCSGCIDIRKGVDPLNTGKWQVGATVVSNGALTVCKGFPNMVGGSVSSMSIVQNGNGYPFSTTIPCVIHNMPGDTAGSGAVINANTNGTGAIISYTIVSGGSGYLYPPMISPDSKWSYDGIHFTSRAYDEVIFQTQMQPGMFSL
jgi:hypothetical protein